MNILEALEILSGYLLKYDEKFIFHPEFIEDVRKLLRNELKGQEKKFFQGLVTQLENINSHKRGVYKIDGNEILKNIGRDSYGNLYEFQSIHINSNQFNIRLIIYFDEEVHPYFLAAFYEKDGQHRSKNSYKKQIPIAKYRLGELRQEGIHEC